MKTRKEELEKEIKVYKNLIKKAEKRKLNATFHGEGKLMDKWIKEYNEVVSLDEKEIEKFIPEEERNIEAKRFLGKQFDEMYDVETRYQVTDEEREATKQRAKIRRAAMKLKLEKEILKGWQNNAAEAKQKMMKAKSKQTVKKWSRELQVCEMNIRELERNIKNLKGEK